MAELIRHSHDERSLSFEGYFLENPSPLRLPESTTSLHTVTAYSVTGFDRPKLTGANSAPAPRRRFFHACRCALWRLCAGHLRVRRVSCVRSVNLRTAATQSCLTAGSGSSFNTGATPCSRSHL